MGDFLPLASTPKSLTGDAKPAQTRQINRCANSGASESSTGWTGLNTPFTAFDLHCAERRSLRNFMARVAKLLAYSTDLALTLLPLQATSQAHPNLGHVINCQACSSLNAGQSALFQGDNQKIGASTRPVGTH